MSMSSCLFQDLGSSDLRKDVYIVVHIIRIGGSYYAASLLYQALHVFLNLLGFRSSSVVTVGVVFFCLVFCACVFAGRMGAGEKKNLCSVQYRRPFGCAVVSIADLLTADSKDDHLLKVYA